MKQKNQAKTSTLQFISFISYRLVYSDFLELHLFNQLAQKIFQQSGTDICAKIAQMCQLTHSNDEKCVKVAQVCQLTHFS